MTHPVIIIKLRRGLLELLPKNVNRFQSSLIRVYQFFPILLPPPPCTLPTLQHFPQPLSTCPLVVYMFFGFSISYTILNLPLFCAYLLLLCFLFPIPFLPILPLPFPTDNPPCDLYFCESVPVLVVCLVCLCFCLCSGCLLSLFMFMFQVGC